MKILIVDDSKVARNLICSEIGEAGKYEVLEASNGQEAIAMLKQQRDISLVTLDVEMPGWDGFQTCRKIRELESLQRDEGPVRFVPIVFLTSKDTLTERAKGFEAGATEFLVKSQMRGSIKITIERILNPDMRWKGMTAAVVDAHDLSRTIASRVLHSRGLEVEEFISSTDCFAALRESPNKFDIIITEHQLPHIDGISLCEGIRKTLGQKAVPILFVSAEPDRNVTLNFFKSGATDYLGKPYFKEEFLARMNTHLNLKLFNKNLQDNVDYLDQLNQIKNKVLSICSHDLRSPLNGILGLTQIMLEDEGLTERNKNFLSQIAVSGNYLNKLISDLLDVDQIKNKGEKLNLEEVVLDDVITRSVNSHRELARVKKITINFRSEFSHPAMILTNEMSVSRIVDNLLSNAIKFSVEGHQVGIFIQNKGAQRIRIEVVDNGVGIPSDQLEKMRLYDKQDSTKGTGGEAGYGLGFGIVKDLVGNLGGSLEIQSRVGRGTRVLIELPLKKTFVAA